MPGPFGSPLSLCCGSCECPQRVCVTPHCGSITFPFRIIDGVTVEVREAADPVGSGDLLGSCTNEAPHGCCVDLEITEATDVDLVITKEGYHPLTLGPYTVGCSTGLSLNVVMYPTEAEICVYVSGFCEFQREGALVETDAGVSGTTDESGVWCDTIAIDEDGEPSTVNVTVTMEGDCWDPNPLTGTIHPYCNRTPWPGTGWENRGSTIVYPGYHEDCVNWWYPWPVGGEVTWSDQFGTVVLDQPGWISNSWTSRGGRMIWSDETAKCVLCGGLYGIYCRLLKLTTGDVSAWIEAAVRAATCDYVDFRIYRHVQVGVGWEDCSAHDECLNDIGFDGPLPADPAGGCRYKVVLAAWPNAGSTECKEAPPGTVDCPSLANNFWGFICYKDIRVYRADKCWTLISDPVSLDEPESWFIASCDLYEAVDVATGVLTATGCAPDA